MTTRTSKAFTYPHFGRLVFAVGLVLALPAQKADAQLAQLGTCDLCSFALSSNGHVLALGREKEGIELLESATGRRRALFGTNGCCNVTFSEDGTLLAGRTGEGDLVVWDLLRQKPIMNLSKCVTSNIVFSHDDRRLLGERHPDNGESPNYRVSVWDIASGKELDTIQGFQYSIRSIALSPDGSTLATAGCNLSRNLGTPEKSEIKLWSLQQKKLLFELQGHPQHVTCLRFFPSGNLLATASNDKSVLLWDVATGKLLHKLAGHPGPVFPIAISPNGDLLAAGSTNEIWIWSLTPTPKKRAVLRLALKFYQPAWYRWLSLAFSSDATRIASLGFASGQMMPPRTDFVCWDVGTGESFPWLRRGNVLPESLSLTAKKSAETAKVMPLPTQLDARELPGLWDRLKDSDACAAYQAMRTLIAFPRESVPFLGTRIKPVATFPAQSFARWISDLDNEDFSTRGAAQDALQQLDRVVVPDLRKAISGEPSPEAKRRLRSIVEQIEHRVDEVPRPDSLRLYRSFEVLEAIGNAEARGILEVVAAGEPKAWITREARDILQRLRRRLLADR